MALRVEPATPGDADAIAALLTTAFGAPPDAPFADRRLLQWKYFESFGPRSVPRSHVLRQGDTIVAHCLASPLMLRVPSPEVATADGKQDIALSAVCFMDWAGARQVPGAGVILMKRLLAHADVAIVAGGSDATRHAVPRLGFVRHDTIDIYARVVRPLRQARSRPSAGLWKDAARLARNALWSLAPLGPLASDWQAVRIDAFCGTTEGTRAEAFAEHTATYLNYWLRCPVAAVTGFEVRQKGRPAGYFLLSRVGGQTRVAAVRLAEPSPAAWTHAVRLAARTAAADPFTCEIVALASTPAMRSALEACGFRRRGALPLFVHDPGNRLARGVPVQWTSIDDDTAYIHDAANPYQT